jgi:hypothetical protein
VVVTESGHEANPLIKGDGKVEGLFYIKVELASTDVRMTNKQIQPVRNRDYQITQRTRPRGLWGQVWLVVLQPAYFFRTLPLLEATRTWLWAAVLILALMGLSAVRQDAIQNGNGGAPPVDFGSVPDGGDPSGGLGPLKGGFSAVPVDGGGGGGGDGVPFDSGIPPGGIQTPSGSSADIATTWTTALLAGSAIVLGWFILTVILSEVALFNGRAPSLGQNLQVAIWTSIPFALMAGLQIIYYSVGGKVGGAGVSGLLGQWEAYNTLPLFWQNVILSLTSRLTVFWLWSLILIYIAARNALRGKRWSSALVVVVWAVLLVVLPVVTGAVKTTQTQTEEVILPSENPLIVPGETNLTGELQGRFAEREGEVQITPEAGALDGSASSSEGESFSITEVTVAPSEAEPIKPTPVPSTGKG